MLELRAPPAAGPLLPCHSDDEATPREAGSSTSLEKSRLCKQRSDRDDPPSQIIAFLFQDITNDKRQPMERLLDKVNPRPYGGHISSCQGNSYKTLTTCAD